MVNLTIRLPKKTKKKLKESVDRLNQETKSISKATASDVIRDLIDNWLK